MNLTEVKKSLEGQFARELPQGAKRHIVFWYDDEGVFADAIDTLVLDGVKTIKVDNNTMFAVKLYIEDTDKESNLLVYSPYPRPMSRDNWLTDTIKYSQTFSTDETSLNMLNLGIEIALRGVMDKYKQFFRNADRERKFVGYKLAPFSEARIDIGVLSVLCKLTAPNLDGVVRTLLIEMAHNENTAYESIGKFGNTDALWAHIRKAYGYTFEGNSLEKLAILLLTSHLSHSINGAMPDDWKVYVSDNPNCFVFTDNLMRNSKYWDDYNALAAFASDKLGLASVAEQWTIDDIANCDTFEDFDRSIISRINGNITMSAGEYGYYRKTINSRKNRRYYTQFEREFAMLLHACEYLDLSVKHKDLTGASKEELFANYVKDYYKLDSSYRHFIAAYDRLDDKEAFEALYRMVEDSYTNWYLSDLSVKWYAHLDDEEVWSMPDLGAQQRFYERYVRSDISKNERVVVIISDGLRYESAVELTALLNYEQKGESKLEPMFGVIPSITTLGMAALLPHKQIDITCKAEFEISGISTEGTLNRTKILQLAKKEAVAVQYEELTNLNLKQMSEKFAEVKLIYIYHNAIDGRGDNAATENEVFEATEKAFKDLSALVRKLRNGISAINILITADHGYIYRRTSLFEHDKTSKQDLASIRSGRRYLMASGTIDKQGTINLPMGYLTKENKGIFAILPRSTNCFKIQGAGSRYVHGGATLQEIVIPVIRFTSDKNLKKSMSAIKVSLGLTNLSRKVTSVITHLSFFQNEPVDDKHLPIRVTAYFVDEAGSRISNENIIIADSTDTQPEKRVYKEKFTLKDMAYKKGASYYLVLKDEDELVNTELERIPFTIDLVFGGSIQF